MCRGGRVQFATAVALLASALALLSPAHGQTTSGNSTTGSTLWANKGCGGCHGITTKPINAANAGGHITYAISQGMPASVTAGEANDIAAYIGTFLSSPSANVAQNSGGNAISLPGFFLNSVYGDYSSVTVVTGPTKGSVSIAGTTATYTPSAGQSGADSFTYRANRPGGTSSVRTATVNIIVPAPTNDNFASRAVIFGGQATPFGTNTGASKEAGEQATYPNGNAGGKSVWWRWNAPSTNPVTITTTGSNFDTMLQVFTGSAVNALTSVAFNDDSIGLQSSVTFNAVFGTQYQIVVDGYSGTNGTISLNLTQQQSLRVIALNSVGASGRVVSDVGGIDCLDASCTVNFDPGTTVTLTATAQPGSTFAGWLGGGCTGYAPTCAVFVEAATTVYANFRPLVNDNFANRIVLAPGVTSDSAYNPDATKEAGEPNHAFNLGGRSLWWSWTAPTSGSVRISTTGSDFDTVLGVYTGSAVDALTTVAYNDDHPLNGCCLSSTVFYANAGTQYHFAIDGYGGSFGLAAFVFERPGNDNFWGLLPLSGGTVSVVDNNTTATREASEPLIGGNSGGHSLWWSWVAPGNATVTIDTCGSSFDTTLGVYTGFSVGALTLVASNDDAFACPGNNAASRVQFAAVASTQYMIAVDGYSGATGAITLNIVQPQPQTISFAPLPAIAFGPAPLVVSATASSGLTVSFASSTPLVCTVAGANVTLVSIGTCSIVAGQAGNASYFAAADVTQSFVISQGPQSIVFDPQTNQNFSNGLSVMINPQAVASSGLAVVYTSNTTGVCTVSGSTVNVLSTGNCSITASQPGNANYTPAAPVTQVFTISPGGQAINFPAQVAQPYVPGGSFMIAPPAAATSGLPISYGGTTPLVCTVSGGVVSIVATGTCVITANQGGNANFNPAPQVTQSVNINPGQPGAPVIGAATGGDAQAAIAFTPSANTGGVPIANFTATCTANGQTTRTGSGTSSPVSVTQLTNDIAYSCTVTATNGAMLTSAASGAVNITPTATPVAPQFTSAVSASFTVLSAGSFTVTTTGTPAPTRSVTGSLPNGVTFTSGSGALAGIPATGTVGSYPLTFTAMNATGTVMQSFTLTVTQASQSITFNNPGAQVFSAAPVMLVASSSSLLPVSFASLTPSTCSTSGGTYSMLAPGSCTISASQAGNTDYAAAAPVQQTFAIGAGSNTISFLAQAIATRNFATGSSFAINPLATASSGLPVSYSSTTPSVCTVSGTSVTMLAAGTCTIAANQSGNGSFAAAMQVIQSVTINAVVPGAPVITNSAAGNTQATITFGAPANNGGSAISSYTASCGAFSNTSLTVTPIAVSGLTNNTTYTCTVKATNATGQGAASTGVQVTPLSSSGATTWATTCAVSGCHGAPPPAPPFQLPLPPRFNAAGSTTTVMDYVFANQAIMKLLPSVTGLTPAQRQELAAYLLSQSPGVNVTTPFNTAANVDVFPNIVLNSPTATFQSVEVVTGPTSGTLSGGGFTGTSITYTPNNGFTGTDSFTYRGKNTSGTPFVGDAREVFITVQPPGPVITSALTANGTVGQPFAYQITATNLPTLYTATGLPGTLTFNASTGVISGTPTSAAILNITLGATNATSSDSKQLVITISPASQFISFPAQVALTRAFSAGGTFPINPTASGGTSGNPIVYGSATTGVCTVSGTTVTIVAAGICTLTADQAGNANFAAAPTATQGVTITPVAPGVPSGIGGTAGNASAIISFTPPASNGGSPITFYTVTCNNGAVPVNGAGTPITVTQLTIGLQYSCSVTATSAGGTSASSVSVNVTPIAISFDGTVVSRKFHPGTVQGLDIPINPNTAITGAVDVEPRVIGAGHQIIFGFTGTPSSVTSLAVTDAANQPIGSASYAFNTNQLVVTLTNIPDNRRVKVTATGVNGAINVSASIGFLVGDVNGSGTVTATDIAYIKARSAQPFDAAKFKADINANGAVTASDVTAVKSQAGKTLP